jgi:hypothetical protein
MLLGPRSIAVSHRVVLCIAQFPGGSVGPVRVVRETEACSLCPDDSVLCGTSRQSNTHSSEVREIRYPWHPWYGRAVCIHGALVKGGQALYHCSLEQNHQAPLFQIPQWMFESGACCRMHRAEEPAVDCAALRDLRRLLHHTRSPGRDFVVQAQHHSSPGGTDARIGESTKGSANRVVSPSTTDSDLAKATARNPTENRKPTRATVARTQPEKPSGEGAMR